MVFFASSDVEEVGLARRQQRSDRSLNSLARGGATRERVLSHLLNSSFAAAPASPGGRQRGGGPDPQAPLIYARRVGRGSAGGALSTSVYAAPVCW